MEYDPSMIPRTLFSPEHETFRDSVRRFMEVEVVPHDERWQEQGYVDREVWKKAGANGFLCCSMPETYGGAGADRLYSMVLMEEQARANNSSLGWGLHSEIVAPYLLRYGSEALKKKYLPKMAAGEMIGAIAMSEPGTGSDLQSVRTTAVPDGDDLVINGSKIFITNGYLSDLVVVVVRTGNSGEGSKDISLVVIEADRPGFTKGKPLKKVGMHSQDTCELFFKDVRVPKSNLLGHPGMGFVMLMQELAWERLMIAITSIAGAEASLKHTLEYTRSRKVFGKPVAAYQNSRFKLAEMKAELAIGRVYVDKCIELVLKKKLGVDDAATAKYWTSDLMCRVIDECVQLHGGYGYMLEYPIARAWIDSRAQRIYGGTNEIMKELIARTL
ncbi:MAG: acyl-CoA dehydrogenase family protein [Nevskiales bacterium]